MATVERTTDLDKNLTIIKMAGSLSASDVVEALRQFYENGPTRDIIWDLRAADLSSFDAEGCKSMIAYAKTEAPRRPDGRSALVGDKDTSFGIVRMYETLAELHEHPIIHATFRSMEEAHNWLSHTPAT